MGRADLFGRGVLHASPLRLAALATSPAAQGRISVPQSLPSSSPALRGSDSASGAHFTSAARRIIQRAMLKTQIIITTKTTRLRGTLRVCAI
ncbi:MAG: hypothetical protein VR75_12525 [Hyphomonadaceae bacterium BRH_c29]|nr:MAG: hypothetical protein VR75_12525 [Hyphomonadaceae bacterium BRH_c29]